MLVQLLQFLPVLISDCNPDASVALVPIVSGWSRPAWGVVQPTSRSPPPPLPPPAGRKVCDVTAYGATGRGFSFDTASIAAAIAECQAHPDGGVVLLPGSTSPRVYLIDAPLNISGDGMALRIESGAVLRAVTHGDSWPQGGDPADPRAAIGFNPDCADALDLAHCGAQFHPVVYATNSARVSLEGAGTIEVDGIAWWKPWCDGGVRPKALRPFVVRIHNSTDVMLRDVTILNAPFWTVVPTFVTGVRIHNISIANPQWSPNTDGIEPMRSTDITVTRCVVPSASCPLRRARADRLYPSLCLSLPRAQRVREQRG